MTVERVMVCDNCSGIIAAEDSVKMVRFAARTQCGAKSIKGNDYCADCLRRGYPKSDS